MVLLKYFAKKYKKEWLADFDTVRGMCCDGEPVSNILHYRWQSKGEKYCTFYNFYIPSLSLLFLELSASYYTYILIRLLYRRNKCLPCLWCPFVPQWDLFTAAILPTKELKVAVAGTWSLRGSSLTERMYFYKAIRCPDT